MQQGRRVQIEGAQIRSCQPLWALAKNFTLGAIAHSENLVLRGRSPREQSPGKKCYAFENSTFNLSGNFPQRLFDDALQWPDRP